MTYDDNEKQGYLPTQATDDFAFTYFKYFVSDSYNRMELMTGYYGSYIIRSSDNSIGGSLGSSPYIYRTGQTHISDG